VDCSDFNITVVGLGVIGGSYATAIQKRLKPKNLWGVDTNKDTLLFAEKTGIIHRGYTFAEEPLRKSDFVFICIYPRATVKFIRENMNHFKPGAVVADTAGIKGAIIKELYDVSRDDVDFIGGHPMAGREGRGLEFASDEIFRESGCYITPTSKNKPANIRVLKNILTKIGFKNIIEIDPAVHDDMIAFTSHLPHIIATALMLNPMIKKESLCIGGSFRDATRVARINPDLWVELLLDNGDNALRHLEEFEADVLGIKNAILHKDENRLRKLLLKACKRKEELSLNADN